MKIIKTITSCKVYEETYEEWPVEFRFGKYSLIIVLTDYAKSFIFKKKLISWDITDILVSSWYILDDNKSNSNFINEIADIITKDWWTIYQPLADKLRVWTASIEYKYIEENEH